MTVLSGKRIRERLEDDDLEKRLVVSPLLEPNEQLREDQASIDVRLGCQFALVTPSYFGTINEFDDWWKASGSSMLKNLYRKQYVSLGGEIIIHPHHFILAETLEYLRLPQNLMSYVVGRSTWGRLGLTVATAIGVHPGFAGPITLELRNLGETPLTLYPGQTIAQLFFHWVDVGDVSGKGLGQYSGAVDVLPRRISSNTTHKKIELLREKKRTAQET